MTIKSDFIPYIDGNGLLAPNPVPPGVMRGSDNGPMFTAEYYVLLQLAGALTNEDKAKFVSVILSCVGSDGELHRAPGDVSPDEVDDYYGVYNALVQLNIYLPIKLPIRLWRQPQLVCAAITAANQGRSLKERAIRLLAAPLYVYSALIIATSCMFSDSSDTDARRLCWLLIQAVCPSSLLCRLASKIWFKRLYRDFPGGMNDVAAIYYQPQGTNPYAKYWVT